MRYEQIRDCAEDGDTLMVEGRGPFSMLVRILTGRSVSHVAMLVWIESGLWVVEMREFTGVRLTPASQWVEYYTARATVYYGKAPGNIRARGGEPIMEAALSQRWDRYNYAELVMLWLSRVLRFQWKGSRICSSMIARCWSVGDGMTFMRAPFPGDFLHLSDWTAAIAS